MESQSSPDRAEGSSEPQKWKHLPKFVGVGIMATTYFVMSRAGADSSDAQVCAGAAGALFGAICLWWRDQPSLPDEKYPPLSITRRTATAALIMVLAFLVETVTAELVLNIADVVLRTAEAGRDSATEVRRAVNLYFAIPIGLCFLFVIGFWSAKKLPVRHPLRWLLGIVIAWYGIRFSFYGVTLRLAKEQGINLPHFWLAVLKTLPVMALSYASLITGNFFGRRRLGKRYRAAQGEASGRDDDFDYSAGGLGDK